MGGRDDDQSVTMDTVKYMVKVAAQVVACTYVALGGAGYSTITGGGGSVTALGVAELVQSRPSWVPP